MDLVYSKYAKETMVKNDFSKILLNKSHRYPEKAKILEIFLVVLT